ncbi:calcium:proton antiporter [Pigmentiphaga litoralis]|uniref:Ca2+:H+ antiporter n=1 Tax=Pigmentiphaga litoralis TaxID=516702 RepID=A0A7Y9IS55_9BURK|nr:calcium:proton antiporter [Pigmentiphaga litoralis]NYE25022.1 Ca2+:H+ antiporter [Pigmentiphaga litoralis]NYE81364.1 Ca2+:H+ antiporter [Pigmentiphaga litoralis]
MVALLLREKFLLLALLSTVLAYAFEHTLLAHGEVTALVVSGLLIGAILCASIRVAHHAELLAEKVGDPYGTMILTLSAVLVEVIILAIMMQHSESPTLVRDTIYSAVMLDINGILGLAALMGGLKHGEQAYNDDSSRTYSVMILTAMGISMVVPEFIPEARWELYSGFTIVVMLILYSLFLRMQTGPHSYFFSYSYPEKRKRRGTVGASPAASTAAGSAAAGSSAPASTAPTSASTASPTDKVAATASAAAPQDLAADGAPVVAHEAEPTNIKESIGVLIFGVIVIGALAEVMSKTLQLGLSSTGAPPIVTALLVATISAGPEILTALRAALANRMQSVVNIALGASLSTVILTVPVMEAVALYTGQPFQMAMTPVQTVMVAITLIVAAINLNDGQTNAIEGMTHFVLFATFLMLSVMGL